MSPTARRATRRCDKYQTQFDCRKRGTPPGCPRVSIPSTRESQIKSTSTTQVSPIMVACLAAVISRAHTTPEADSAFVFWMGRVIVNSVVSARNASRCWVVLRWAAVLHLARVVEHADVSVGCVGGKIKSSWRTPATLKFKRGSSLLRGTIADFLKQYLSCLSTSVSARVRLVFQPRIPPRVAIPVVSAVLAGSIQAGHRHSRSLVRQTFFFFMISGANNISVGRFEPRTRAFVERLTVRNNYLSCL